MFTNGGDVPFKDNLDFGSGGIIFDEGHEYNINGQDLHLKEQELISEKKAL